ncbi:MAG: OmpA family protein [Acidobacteria bacterium]|nr:OmpA family protein [Acidobacteriota bacterium]
MLARVIKSDLLMCVLMAAIFGWSCARPVAKLKVSRNEIKQGDPVTVSWETKNAKSVLLNGEKVEKLGAKTVTPKQTTIYELIAKRGKKEASDKATIKVEIVKKPAPTIALRSEPSAIERGHNSLLKWSTENSKIVTISGLGEVPASGEREISPRVSTTYTGTAMGEGGTATASTRITVTDPPVPIADRPRTTSDKTSPTIAQQFNKAVTPIYFDFNEADLKPSEQEKLRRMAEWLLKDKNRTISFRIEGNCDPRGTAEYNLGLGDRRAREAKEFFISLGVDPNRIDTISYGLEKAKGSSEGSQEIVPSWAHDRRDDFTYLRGGDPY